ncbi:hypothetical protein [Gordonia sp. MP11Mi]|uniref:J domain-containing protein n=1 Tax=Gordonia sp. MP11Mi TaxID=3022769 RepID=A0AA97CZ23_9ACTN
MPAPGPNQPTDYYGALGLRPASPTHALVSQLSHRAAQLPPGPERDYVEQARAILGDPRKRPIYDGRLNDSTAPAWTPRELHEFALAQPPRTAATGALSMLTAIPRRVLTGIVAGLAVLLVLIIALVSCSGSGSDDVSADTASGLGPEAAASASTTVDASCEIVALDGEIPNQAAWSATNDYALQLTGQYPIASPQSARNPISIINGVHQYADHTIGVQSDNHRDQIDVMPQYLSVHSPSGPPVKVIEQTGVNIDYTPLPTPISKNTEFSGRYRIVAGDVGDDYLPTVGLAGQPEAGNLSVLYGVADKFQPNTVWLVIDGGARLFKAQLVKGTSCE